MIPEAIGGTGGVGITGFGVPPATALVAKSATACW